VQMVGHFWMQFNTTVVLARKFYRHKRLPVPGSTETKLRSLLDMSQDMLDEIPISAETRDDVVRRSLKKTEKVKTYCACIIVRDSTVEGRPPGEDIATQWRLDFAHPNRWHVSQAGWDVEMGMLFDEWVTIGTENYQNAGLWSRTKDGFNTELNQRLLVDNLLQVLRKLEATSSKAFKYRDHRYLLLQYDNLAGVEVCREFLGVPDDVEGVCKIQIWIDLETHLLVKGAYILEAKMQEGELVDIGMHYAFTAHNEDVKVEPPPWLNVEQNSEGEDVVSSTEVPILYYHP